MNQNRLSELVISCYGSHNAAIACHCGASGEIVVVEIERLTGFKNSGLAQYKGIAHADFYVRQALRQFPVSARRPCDVLISANMSAVIGNARDARTVNCDAEIPSAADAKMLRYSHHESHAAGTYYQSPFDKSLIFSFDGGGDDGFFNVYAAYSRAEGPIEIASIPYDLGFPYMIFGEFIAEISSERSLADGNLIYSGKLMGLCAYGKVREDWLSAFKDFYLAKPCMKTYRDKIAVLGQRIGIRFDENHRLSMPLSGDIAATSQQAFEDLFMEFAGKFLAKYDDYPICITGGCALNVLLNSEIRKRFKRPMFVAPNSSDCGIAVGGLLKYLKPSKPVNLIYSGIPLLDIDALPHFAFERSAESSIESASPGRTAALLHDGAILGVARGRAEHGPRALGNRSILCDPGKPGMKDTLNAKVKHREWYRPFAPVVKYEDANEYFEILDESPYMSFAFKVRERWRETLSSITHVDGTARVQTLRREVNPWLYDLLGDFEKLSGYGVLLNTSFNVNGKPILSTVREAMQLYDHTELDGIVVEDNLLLKSNFRQRLT